MPTTAGNSLAWLSRAEDATTQHVEAVSFRGFLLYVRVGIGVDIHVQ